MALDRFLIAPINGGLQTDLKPWIIPDDAVAQLNNAYVFRGRLRKRFGSRYLNDGILGDVAQFSSRVRINIGTANNTINIPGSGLAIGQSFSVGSDMFTVYQLGANVATLSTSTTGGTATINSTTMPNTVTISGEIGGTIVYYYPSTPIMGMIPYETPEPTPNPTFVWDTQFAYQFTSGAFQRLGTAVWTGTDSQFFWGTTWNGATPDIRYLFVTNNNPADGIKYYNGTDFVLLNPVVALNAAQTVGTTDGTGAATGTVPGGTGAIGQVFMVGAQIYNVTLANGALSTTGSGSGTFNTATGAFTFTGAALNASIQWFTVASTLVTARMVVVFKNRLVVFNTVESVSGVNKKFTNRARWASFGDPTGLNSWNQTIAGFGNALDADTMEDIISCGFIKDRLIVYFERSTYEFVFTGNQAQPFTWQKLNNELGAEATFSSVQFDKVLLTVGNTGVHACNGVNVQRIDDKIPDTVWSIHDGATNVERVYGIRDYYAEQVYWTFPNVNTDPNSSVYPTKVLVFNYKTGSWAFNDDSITTFGYYYAAAESAITWDSEDVTWDNDTITWDSGIGQPLNQEIIAGNQQGFVFIVDSELATNAAALQITNIALVSSAVRLTVINHNLNVGDYIYVQFLNGLTGPFKPIYQVTFVLDSNTFTIIAPDIQAAFTLGQVYTGGGTITRVSQIDILTKQFNFYAQDDRDATVQKVNFLVDRTASGAFTVDAFVSTNSEGGLEEALANGSILGDGTVSTAPYALYPNEQKQDRLWHPAYLNANGNAIQFHIYLSDEQMRDFSVATSGFQMHAMMIYTQPTSQRLQ